MVFILNIVLAFLVLFKERKRASSLWAWALVLVFLPVAGFLLYLLFGQPHMKSKGRHSGMYVNPEMEERAASQLKAMEAGTSAEQSKLEKGLQELALMQLRTAAAPLSYQKASIQVSDCMQFCK